MNSKFFTLPLVGVCIVGCGVKSSPLNYPDTIVESYTREYTRAEPTLEEIERSKKKDIIPTSLDPKRIQQPTTATPNP